MQTVQYMASKVVLELIETVNKWPKKLCEESYLHPQNNLHQVKCANVWCGILGQFTWLHSDGCNGVGMFEFESQVWTDI